MTRRNSSTRTRRAATIVAGALAFVALGACERDDGRRADADNTARNVRERDERTVTPLDQGHSEGDRSITQHIRKTVVANDSLSTNARNVKIVTQDGVVTLRGPVDSAQEKSLVVAAAQAAPGVKRVDDQLEVVEARN